MYSESRLFKVASAALILGFCLTIGYSYLSSHRLVREIYEAETRSTIIDFKKTFLKNTVDNFISQLEEELNINKEFLRVSVDTHYASLKHITDLKCSDFLQALYSEFDLLNNRKQDIPKWTVLIWDNSGKILYSPIWCSQKEPNAALEEIKPCMSSFKTIEYSGINCLFGYSKKYLSYITKAKAEASIKSMHFGYGSYIWVYEVLNYDGGENYAITRINTKMPQTEGTYLSTSFRDGIGNRPYLTELHGLKTSGELFVPHYYKDRKSGKVTEETSYAKLYKEFNWVVAMGMHYDEMEEYIASTNAKALNLARSKTQNMLAVLIVFMLAFIVVMLLWEKLSYKQSKAQMEAEINIDSLTIAKSRKFGISYLEQAFKKYTRDSSLNIALIVFDVDNFKKINDVYGHVGGDGVLKEIVLAANATIRSTDILFRLGGDEFVAVFNGVSERDADTCALKVLNAVSSLKYMINDEELALSISVGLARFLESDTEYLDSLKRADKAMYISKENGGNRLTAG